MNYFNLLIASIIFTFSGKAFERPNVLFISVDDWNDWIGAYGDNQAKTPNIDKLAAGGVSFINAHTSAVYCAPSRTSLMTGLNPHSLGAYRDQPHFAPQNHPELKDLPIWFRENGYHTAGGGKLYHHMPGFIDMRGWHKYFHWSKHGIAKGWHLDSWGGDAPLPKEIPASPIAKYLYEKDKARNPDKKLKKLNSHMEWGKLPNNQEEQMADSICTNWAAKFIANYKGEKPFFLGFGLYAPHKPNFVPAKYYQMNPLSDIEQPKMEPGDLDDLPPTLQKKMINRKNHIDNPLRQLKSGKKAVQGYLAALSYADAMIGRVLDSLGKSSHAQNTIVVLWSDNGYHLGEKGAWAKHTLWERTSNVPYIWSGPGITVNAKVDATVSLLDTYPTLLELCSLPQNDKNEGQSLASVLKSPKSAIDKTVIQCADHDEFALINRDWRYVQTRNKEEQLYNLKVDPKEHNNLVKNNRYSETLSKFRKQIPVKVATPGKTPRELRLEINGQNFEWKARKMKNDN